MLLSFVFVSLVVMALYSLLSEYGFVEMYSYKNVANDSKGDFPRRILSSLKHNMYFHELDSELEELAEIRLHSGYEENLTLLSRPIPNLSKNINNAVDSFLSNMRNGWSKTAVSQMSELFSDKYNKQILQSLTGTRLLSIKNPEVMLQYDMKPKIEDILSKNQMLFAEVFPVFDTSPNTSLNNNYILLESRPASIVGTSNAKKQQQGLTKSELSGRNVVLTTFQMLYGNRRPDSSLLSSLNSSIIGLKGQDKNVIDEGIQVYYRQLLSSVEVLYTESVPEISNKVINPPVSKPDDPPVLLGKINEPLQPFKDTLIVFTTCNHLNITLVALQVNLRRLTSLTSFKFILNISNTFNSNHKIDLFIVKKFVCVT